MNAPMHLGCRPDTTVWGWLGPAQPVLRIASGDEVVVDTVNAVGVLPPQQADAFFAQHGLPVEGVTAELAAIVAGAEKGPGPHVLTGPIAVDGARPGDVLEVEVCRLDLRWPPYGVNFTRPGAGTLPALPQASWTKVLRLDPQRGVAHFDERITLPLAPFLGIMAVAPRERVSSIPPGPFGGNIDMKDLQAGATLYLPVQVEDALFFCGDGHALQGDGEVNLTALETALQARLRFTLHRGRAPAWPLAETATHYLVPGLDTDLDRAAEQAVARSVRVLQQALRLEAMDAYALASLAVDFAVTQLVDGVKGVHARIPKATLGRPGRWGPLPCDDVTEDSR